MMGMGVEKRVVDPYSIRYYKTAGVFSACRLLFIGEIFSIAFYKELRLNKLEVAGHNILSTCLGLLIKQNAFDKQ